VVDEYTGQLVADRPVDQQRGDRRVDPAAQRTQDLGIADLLADPVHLLVDDVGRRPIGQEPASVVQEPFHHGLTVRRVGHLGMELHREEPALAVLHRGHRDPVGRRGDAEAVGRARDGVAVTHPDRVGGGKILEQRARLGHVQLGPAVLTVPRGRDLAAQVLGHELVAVADAEHRHAELEQPGIDLRRTLPRRR
jgi:hypothetical protein